MIERLCIIGVGLIGGSVARAARAKGLCHEIVGVDADTDNLRNALECGVIDVGYSDTSQGAASADLVMIATPVGTFDAIFSALKPVWSTRAVVTDAGSTKCNVIESAERVFGEIPDNFVPGHPIAGAERSGVDASTADLYQGKRVILTPLNNTSPLAIKRVERFWRAIGAKVSEMEPAHHDEVLAATSHLPHVLAFTLTYMLGKKDEQQEIFQYAAGGFRDFTRIASSDPKMWLDICLANRRQIVSLIHQFREELSVAAGLISRGAEDELYSLFSEARSARQRFLDQLEK
ncbi:MULTISPECIES: prephenate dehydrogenase [Methylocaldum]|jgi:prephenate dehydrogenase|uniref:prephenate dehydrogenase n=1 Tax=Methylocaldum sp. RMAD-M TaxID=2806557 RepID=UPI000A324D00|nr:prephenate dehydrogenase/arogenate dehydrogenase family protein [Methylocaldum sp. RMAD-M]MBP1148561.1 prephenate dehydrogenase [Methylocaldum sp. RMAD-M]MDV3240927.1 prephenate dehydrogenase/arogenate dehydrogenase family protein [Methylocaldum sp.]MVF21929.1 prephenate dehydrogenase/arogenate dehydrogenase family protein [Methylocaldum sp. BRCS4]